MENITLPAHQEDALAWLVTQLCDKDTTMSLPDGLSIGERVMSEQCTCTFTYEYAIGTRVSSVKPIPLFPNLQGIVMHHHVSWTTPQQPLILYGVEWIGRPRLTWHPETDLMLVVPAP